MIHIARFDLMMWVLLLGLIGLMIGMLLGSAIS